MVGGGLPISVKPLTGGYLTGRGLIYPLTLVLSLFFLWGFSYGLLDVLNKHFQVLLGISKLQSTGLQIVYFGGGYLCFSPIAADLMKRKGYKDTILMGLFFYSLGAIFFWPTTHFSSAAHKLSSFGGFCACTFVIASRLATPETAANSYAVVIGNPATASARLQFCQSWNGVASFIGPLIASHAFFNGANANNLVNVQFVYLAVACAGAVVAVLFTFAKLPEVSQEMLESSTAEKDVTHGGSSQGPIWKQYNMIFDFIEQFCYIGAQVTVASFFINYATENATFSSSQASNLLSYALMTFTLGRFFARALATVFQADFLLMVYVALAIAFTAYATVGTGTAAVAILIVLFFFEAPMYPTIFALGTANLGVDTGREAGILVMGVSGGAAFPPIQGAIADSHGTSISYLVPLVGFYYVLAYVTFHWFYTGRHVMRVKHQGAMIKGGDENVAKSVNDTSRDEIEEPKIEEPNPAHSL